MKTRFLLIYFGLILQSSVSAQFCLSDSVKTFLISDNLSFFRGLGIGLVQKSCEDFKFTYGFQSNDLAINFSDSTIFNIGDISKLFTSIAIMQQVEKGKIALDDPLFKYFPEILDIQGKKKYAHEITIKHLLMHKSGILQSMEHLYPEIFAPKNISSETDYYKKTYNFRASLNIEDFKQRFVDFAKLEARPGKKYHYSNLGMVLLGVVIENVTGENIGNYIKKNIFLPLKMNDSHFHHTPKSKIPLLAKGYYLLSDKTYLNVHENEYESTSPTGDGGIRTSLRDMLRFMRFLVGDVQLQNDYDAVLKRENLLSMMAPQDIADSKLTQIGFGFHIEQGLVGHSAGWDGFLTWMYYHPETHSVMFAVTNREDKELFNFLEVYAIYALYYKEFSTQSFLKGKK